MIEYIENHPLGSTIFYIDDIKQSTHRAQYHIECLCKQALFTYEGYIKALKKVINVSYQIPVFIDQLHGFIPISRVRDYENKWINWFAVSKINEHFNELELQFISGRRLYINYSMKRLKKRIDLLMKIKSMKVNIFIFNDIEIISN
jgi:competence transcription factor ComK